MDPGGSGTGAGCCKADNANHNRYPISVLSSMLLGYWLEGWSLPSVQVIPSHPPRKVKTRRKGQGCKGDVEQVALEVLAHATLPFFSSEKRNFCASEITCTCLR